MDLLPGLFVDQRYVVGESKIPNSGKGLFARTFLEIHELLFIAFAPMGDNFAARKVLEELQKEKEFSKENPRLFEAYFTQLYPNDFLNHSESPNVESLWIGDFIVKRAIKYIEPFEELTSDYRQTISIIEQRGWKLTDDWMDFSNFNNKS